MPTFNGVNIFGQQVTMVTAGTKRESQSNRYFGVDGTEEIDGGFVEHVTMVTGRLNGLFSAGGLADLISAIQTARSYIDGNAYQLVDSYGLAWNNVKLLSFDPQPPIRKTQTEWYIAYTATLKHLSAT